MISPVRDPPALSTAPSRNFSFLLGATLAPTHSPRQSCLCPVPSEVWTESGTPHLTACADLEEQWSE